MQPIDFIISYFLYVDSICALNMVSGNIYTRNECPI